MSSDLGLARPNSSKDASGVTKGAPMRFRKGRVSVILLAACFPLASLAQPALKSTTSVPRLVKFSGVLADDSGKPLTGALGVTFSIYEEERGGAPIWMETQNVYADNTGRYTVMLGSTKNEGIAAEVFASAQGRWLGVQAQSESERARTLLVSVPYALKAVDAETLGGLPVSAFALAAGPHSEVMPPGAPVVPGAKAASPSAVQPALTGTGVANTIPLWTNTTTLGSSILYESTGKEIGVGTASPVAKLDVVTTGTVAVEGTATATTGATYGVYGGSSSSSGFGVWGQGLAGSGPNFGVVGETNSIDYGIGVLGTSPATSGAGMEGIASAASGTTYGVYGTSASTGGVGVSGVATATSGGTAGVSGYTLSNSGAGVYGSSGATSGDTSGVTGYAASTSGNGLYGSNVATTGVANGVSAYTASNNGNGVYGQASAGSGNTSGVNGYSFSTAGAGVSGYGTATSGNASGVVGFTYATSGYGVAGTNYATSGTNFGLYGAVASSFGIGVYGKGVTASAVGLSKSPPAYGPPGVWGDSSTGFGVVGTSDYTNAVSAYSTATSTAALYAENDTTTNSTAIVIASYSPHYGGFCDIFANGNLQCSGSVGGHAYVSNSRELSLYGVQAAENWMEDAGSGQLQAGRAVIQLEAEYAQTVNAAVDYHVFLTPNGDCKGLFVSQKSPTSFEVRELGGGTANIAFDYRIMARRKGFEDIRLADITGKIDRGPQARAPGGSAMAKRPESGPPTGASMPAAHVARPAPAMKPAALPTTVK